MLYLSKLWYVRFCVSMMHDNDDNSETKIIIIKKRRITLNRQHEWAITTGMNPILIGGQTKITPHEYENYMLGCIQTYTLHRKTVRHDRCYFSIRAYAWALYWMLCYAMLCCVKLCCLSFQSAPKILFNGMLLQFTNQTMFKNDAFPILLIYLFIHCILVHVDLCREKPPTHLSFILFGWKEIL